MPPATATSRSPARIDWSTMPAERMPEAQTLFTVSEETSLGIPPLIWAWRRGHLALPRLQHLAEHHVLAPGRAPRRRARARARWRGRRGRWRRARRGRRPSSRTGCGRYRGSRSWASDVLCRRGSGTIMGAVNVAIATCAALSGGFDEDRPLAEALGRAAWMWPSPSGTRPAVDWDRFDRVMVRSTWDYTPRRDDFLAWADVARRKGPERAGACCAGTATSATWPISPTRGCRWWKPTSSGPATRSLTLDGEVVVKPTISAGARDTGRFSASTHARRWRW